MIFGIVAHCFNVGDLLRLKIHTQLILFIDSSLVSLKKISALFIYMCLSAEMMTVQNGKCEHTFFKGWQHSMWNTSGK